MSQAGEPSAFQHFHSVVLIWHNHGLIAFTAHSDRMRSLASPQLPTGNMARQSSHPYAQGASVQIQPRTQGEPWTHRAKSSWRLGGLPEGWLRSEGTAPKGLQWQALLARGITASPTSLRPAHAFLPPPSGAGCQDHLHRLSPVW